jgi:hypothetical protein
MSIVQLQTHSRAIPQHYKDPETTAQRLAAYQGLFLPSDLSILAQRFVPRALWHSCLGETIIQCQEEEGGPAGRR